jgi:ornithine cyclodeaminase/alanine dehydrogenase-like protein (mu-crystallin family)
MTLVLARGDVTALLTLDECIAAVEEAFALQGAGRALGPGVLGLHVPDGGFHVKVAGLPLSRLYIAVKLNANFPDNGPRRGLPTIQGVIALADGETGRPLALMDSMEITVLRTGAATAVAARHLARADAHVVTIVGCGARAASSSPRSRECVRSSAPMRWTRTPRRRDNSRRRRLSCSAWTCGRAGRSPTSRRSAISA